jgi:hypothetical protein
VDPAPRGHRTTAIVHALRTRNFSDNQALRPNCLSRTPIEVRRRAADPIF